MGMSQKGNQLVAAATNTVYEKTDSSRIAFNKTHNAASIDLHIPLWCCCLRYRSTEQRVEIGMERGYHNMRQNAMRILTL